MFLLIIITTFSIFLGALSRSDKWIKITYTDVVVVLYLFYGVFSLILIRQAPPDSMLICRWIMLACLYPAVRNVSGSIFIIWFIVILGVIQVLIGIAQLCGWMASWHDDFPVTGTFPNPGPYGGFLALSLVAVVWLLRYSGQYKIIGYSLSVLFLTMLVVADSRAAWLATLVGSVTVLPVMRRWWIRAVTGVVVCVFIVGLYFYRPGSADARLLVWRVCTQLIETSPVTGHGVGSLSQHYMAAQADFFIAHPDSEFIAVANNNYQAFNEFIHLTVEQGIIGLLLLLGIIFSCRKSAFFPLLLSWCCFAMFSYPADDDLFMVVLVVLFALSSTGEVYCFNLNRKWLLCGLVTVPFVVVMNVKYDRALAEIETTTSAVFPNNREYMLRFAKQKQDIPVFNHLIRNVCSSSDILCDMGDCYKRHHETALADSCYVLAHRMVPCRIVPLHKLLLLYSEKDSLKSRDYALQILNFETTMVGSTILRARADAKKCLNHD